MRLLIPAQGTALRREGAARLRADWLNAEARWKFEQETGGHGTDIPVLPVERVWCDVTGCKRREAHHHAAVMPPVHESGLTRAQRRSIQLPRRVRTPRAGQAVR